MSDLKLSQITTAAGASYTPGPTDYIVGTGVGNTTDYLYSLSEIGRQVLTADASYYVDASTGSDSNDGKTSGTAWATLNHGVAVTQSTLDGGGFGLTFNIAAGTYTLTILETWAQFSTVTFLGAGSASTTINNVAIGLDGDTDKYFPMTAALFFDGVTFADGGSSGYCFYLLALCECTFGDSGLADVAVGPADPSGSFGGEQIYAHGQGARIGILGNFTFNAGTSGFGITSEDSASIYLHAAITVSGTPDYSAGSFFWVGNFGEIESVGSTITGSATGPGLTVMPDGMFNTYDSGTSGAAFTYLPGNTPAIISPSGVVAFHGWQVNAVDFEVPTTGTTVTVKGTYPRLIIDPAGTLAALTINLVIDNVVPIWGADGDTWTYEIFFAQAITAATWASTGGSGGQTIGAGFPSSISAGQLVEAIFNFTTNTWYAGVGGGGSSGLVIGTTPLSGGGGNPGVGTSGYFLWNPGGAGPLEDSDDGGTGAFYRNDAGFTGFDTLGTQNCLAQRGDTDGVSALYIRNRSGSNGGIFQNFSLDLVDLGFNPSSNTQSNFRLEHRMANLVNASNSGGEFQFINAGSSTVWFASGPGVASLTTPVIPGNYIVSALPTPVAGMRATVTDSTVALSGAAIGSAPIGSGAHTVPVFANETPAWVIG